jgi:hypothetical protein
LNEKKKKKKLLALCLVIHFLRFFFLAQNDLRGRELSYLQGGSGKKVSNFLID